MLLRTYVCNIKLKPHTYLGASKAGVSRSVNECSLTASGHPPRLRYLQQPETITDNTLPLSGIILSLHKENTIQSASLPPPTPNPACNQLQMIINLINASPDRRRRDPPWCIFKPPIALLNTFINTVS